MQMRGTDFLLGGNAEGMDGSFFCIPAARTAGARDNGLIIDAIVMSASKIKWIAILQKMLYNNLAS